MSDNSPSLRARKTAASRIGVTLAFYDQMRAAGRKWCIACRLWHPVRSFGSDRSRSDGLAAACLNSRQPATGLPGVRERRVYTARGLAWCRGCMTWLPLGEVRAGVCREHSNAESRAHYAQNRDEICSKKTARTRHLEPVPGWWRAACFARFGGLCAYGCGRAATALDHIWPVARGGKSRPSNLAPTCKSCNSRKHATHPYSWVERGVTAFPDEWTELVALAFEHGADEWTEEAA